MYLFIECFETLVFVLDSICYVFLGLNCVTRAPNSESTNHLKPSSRVNVEFAHTILRKIDLSPIHIAGAECLQELVDKCVAWKDEVNLLFHDGSSTTSKTSKSNLHSSSSGSNKAVNLKKVELLLDDGEKFPFDLEDDLELLREKRVQAKAWLEKLKKSFQVKTISSRVGSVRRGAGASGSGSADTVDRLNLADMKTMVEEGSTMFEIMGGEESNAPRGRDSAQVRELSKAQSVVEIAEEWINRMKELLAADPDSYITDDDDDDNDDDANEVDEKSVTNEENEAKVSKDVTTKWETSSPSDDIGVCGNGTTSSIVTNKLKQKRGTPLREVLREMLREADDMPVHMDEVHVLRVHLQALDWADKIRNVLPLPTADVATNAATTTTTTTTTKPALSKISEFATEIKRLQ